MKKPYTVQDKYFIKKIYFLENMKKALVLSDQEKLKESNEIYDQLLINKNDETIQEYLHSVYANKGLNFIGLHEYSEAIECFSLGKDLNIDNELINDALMIYLPSIYFHGRGGSIASGKAVSFKNLFKTIPIPYNRNYDDAVRYFGKNFSDSKTLVLIGDSAGVLPIINICHNFTDQIQKVVLLNPATSMMNINTINDTIKVKIYSATNDYGRNIYMEGDTPNENIEVISIPGNHNFTGRDDMINEIIKNELLIH